MPRRLVTITACLVAFLLVALFAGGAAGVLADRRCSSHVENARVAAALETDIQQLKVIQAALLAEREAMRAAHSQWLTAARHVLLPALRSLCAAVRAHISESVFGAAMVIVALAVVSSVVSAVVDDDDHGEKCPTSGLIWPDASSVSPPPPPPLLVERHPLLCVLAKRVYVAAARHHRLLCIVRSSVAWLCGSFVVFFLFLRDHAVAPILRGILNFDIYAASDSGSGNSGGAASCQINDAGGSGGGGGAAPTAGGAPPARGSFAVFSDTLALFTEVPLQVGEQAVTAVMLVLALGALTLFLQYTVGKVGLAETERLQMEQDVGALLAEAEML